MTNKQAEEKYYSFEISVSIFMVLFLILILVIWFMAYGNMEPTKIKLINNIAFLVKWFFSGIAFWVLTIFVANSCHAFIKRNECTKENFIRKRIKSDYGE